jgi:hypothetical protein
VPLLDNRQGSCGWPQRRQGVSEGHVAQCDGPGGLRSMRVHEAALPRGLRNHFVRSSQSGRHGNPGTASKRRCRRGANGTESAARSPSGYPPRVLSDRPRHPPTAEVPHVAVDGSLDVYDPAVAEFVVVRTLLNAILCPPSMAALSSPSPVTTVRSEGHEGCKSREALETGRRCRRPA